MMNLPRTLLAVLICLVAGWVRAEAPRVLIVVGPSKHPPGTHEVAAGGRLMRHCLQHMTNLPGVGVELVDTWPDKPQRDAADTVVFIGDTFPANRLPNAAQNLADLDAMMRRGCGIVCVHYATGLLGEDVSPTGEHPLLHWLGGYFANRSCPHHQSLAKVFSAATITPAAPRHPICRGWQEFTLHDEPYINNYFGPQGNRLAANVTALATSMLPPEAPQPETVAWCVAREDGGRGFGVVMPHYYRNWQDDNLRRLILNGIVWTAKLEVPAGGVQTDAPRLADFEPESVDIPVAPPRKPPASAASRPRSDGSAPVPAGGGPATAGPSPR